MAGYGEGARFGSCREHVALIGAGGLRQDGLEIRLAAPHIMNY